MALPFLLGAIFSDGSGREYRLVPTLHAEQRAAEGFVGSATCAAWQASDHARAMAAAAPATVLGDSLCPGPGTAARERRAASAGIT